MISKYNQKGQRKKLLIPEINQKSRENSKPKSVKKQYSDSYEYGTDNKKYLNQSSNSLEQIKDIISQCNQCKAKISQFVTKKPTHVSQRGTQTTHKPFLIDLIEERVEQICRQNAKLNRVLQDREVEILQRQEELNEVQQKFTTILLTLSQEIAFHRQKSTETHEKQKVMTTDSQTPAYIKALLFDD